MWINLRPLRDYRDYRLLLLGQTVSYFGSMISYVAVPWQVFNITHSSLLVGFLATVQLLPVLIFGLIGGSVADSMDRRRLMIVSEGLMSVCSLAFCINASIPKPSLTLIFVLTAVMQSANGFHRPAMDALVQRLVQPKDYAAVSALSIFLRSTASVVAPAVGGMIIATAGLGVAYLIDLTTFLIALATVYQLSASPVAGKSSSHVAGIFEGLRFALGYPELLGTYLVDIIAMTFAFPTALYPAMGEQLGGAKATGMLYSAMAVGSVAVTAISGWSGRIRRHGAMVVISATLWGVAVAGAGLTHRLELAILFLALAGAADTVSGIFRSCIWNEAVPNEMRGRIAGIEMISYMTGPLIGNTRAGWMAGVTSLSFSIVSGGVACALGVPLCAYFLPRLWQYRSKVVS